MRIRKRTLGRLIVTLGAAAGLASALPATALGQEEGGLYIAGSGFTFEQAASRGLAQNPKGQRFFVLALPPLDLPPTSALSTGLTSLSRRRHSGRPAARWGT